ncbi:MAG: NADH-quinone oxidoreductase subunit C [Candidatus Latescibacteria bacterium]|jgi:NADH-quinone oxidoreductase subunit C|nr:NADH-quinone oxidoreductase subunit C [Candidatus Latescibacterota bacterium]
MSQALAEKLQAEFEGSVTDVSSREVARSTPSTQVTVRVERERIVDVLTFARDELGLKFLSDISAIDYLQMSGAERFTVIYVLRNIADGGELILKAAVPEEPAEIDSACSVYKGANWLEREVYDMFGITFLSHPNMTRILTPDEFDGHPLRKDYPVQGRGFRDRFPVISRDAS